MASSAPISDHAFPGDASLLDRFTRGVEAHIAAEVHDMAAAQTLAERIGDPFVAHLLGVLVGGEQRDKALLDDLLLRLQTPPEAGAVSRQAAVDADLIAGLRELIRDQHEGARYLRHLARQAPPQPVGFYATLLEMLARDSETRVTALRYVLRRAEETLA